MTKNKAAVELGRLGGRATKTRNSPDYYRIIGAMGGRKKGKNRRIDKLNKRVQIKKVGDKLSVANGSE